MGQLVHALPALDGHGRVGPGAGRRAAGRRAAHAARGLDHGAGALARERRAQKNEPQALGRSRDGLTTKLHAVADARGRPVRLARVMHLNAKKGLDRISRSQKKPAMALSPSRWTQTLPKNCLASRKNCLYSLERP